MVQQHNDFCCSIGADNNIKRICSSSSLNLKVCGQNGHKRRAKCSASSGDQRLVEHNAFLVHQTAMKRERQRGSSTATDVDYDCGGTS